MSDIRITYDGADKHGTLEGMAFIGTMLSRGECQALAFGKLSPNRMMDITASNLAAFISICREMREPPTEILDNVMKIMAASFTKTLEQMKSTSDGSAYDMEFLLELMRMVVEMDKK